VDTEEAVDDVDTWDVELQIEEEEKDVDTRLELLDEGSDTILAPHTPVFALGAPTDDFM